MHIFLFQYEFTSPSESDDEEELLDVLPLVDEEESLESEEESEDELLDVEDELELLPRFFTGVFLVFPLCSCSSLASSLCSI